MMTSFQAREEREEGTVAYKQVLGEGMGERGEGAPSPMLKKPSGTFGPSLILP